MENALQEVAVKTFRAQHPKFEFVEDAFARRARVYKSLVERTSDKYKKIAKEQAAKRNLAKAIARAEEELKDRKFQRVVSGQT
jgi:hypothetical protein